MTEFENHPLGLLRQTIIFIVVTLDITPLMLKHVMLYNLLCLLFDSIISPIESKQKARTDFSHNFVVVEIICFL